MYRASFTSVSVETRFVLLYGGDKDSQEQDIRMALALARELED